MKVACAVISVAAVLIIAASLANAAVPMLLNYQGRLTDSSGEPLTGSYSIRFALHGQAAGGAELWSETQDVAVSNGLFAVLLGSINPLSEAVFAGANRWLGMRVGSDPEITPRTRIVSSAFSFHSGTSDSAAVTGSVADNSVTSASIVDGAIDGDDIKAGTIGGDRIAADAIVSSRIENGSILGVDIAASQITTSHILNGSLLGADFVTGSISGTHIADGSIAPADLVPNSISGAEILDLAVGNADLSEDAVTSAKILNGSIGNPDLGPNAVGTSNIVASAVSASKISEDAVTSAKILDGSIGNPDLGPNAVGTSNIVASAVNAGKILDEPGIAANLHTGSAIGFSSADTAVTTILSRTIDPPGSDSGYVMVIGTLQFMFQNPPGIAAYAICGVSTTASQLPTYGYYQVSAPADEDVNAYWHTVTVHGVFRVGPNADTFYLLVKRFPGGGFEIAKAALSLIYLPTSYGTVSVLSGS